MKFNKDILPKWYSIVLWILILFFTQGCYTQLSMFYPEPEMETEDNFVDFYASYSRAPVRPNLTLAAQDGAGQPLSLAYMTMTNRFNFYGGNYMGSRFNNGYYWNEYNLGGYTMYIPYSDPYAAIYATGERKQRTFIRTRDGSTPQTNLNVTRTRSTQSNSSNNNTHTNSSNVSTNRSSSEGSSSSSSSSSSSGRRATKRN